MTIPPVVDDQLIATVWGNAVADAINHGGLFGLEAARPAGVSGMRFFATDTKREFLYDGTGWIVMAEPEQTYTPALTGITLGNGTLTGRYHRSDGWCDFRVKFVLGSTSAIGANPAVGLPITPEGTLGSNGAATGVEFFDATVGIFVGIAAVNGSNVALFANIGIPASATQPFTWAVNDTIWCQGRYLMTTRYS